MSLFPVLFAVYWCSVLAWYLMASRLCVALSRRHPLLYDTLGRPAVSRRSDLRGDLALMRFLLGRRDRFLDDRRLGRLCGAMRTFLWVYALFFLSLPSLMLR
ncbi:MAG TPA: hypothetical protein VFR03_16580 [Thermoanaerobaculia bacterium]|nr:hypothetical protein [Thermoanaerobaculia bacterium]